MATSYKPDGYHSVTPYLVVSEAPRMIEFLERGLGGKEKFRMAADDGSIMHAEVVVGDSHVMVGSAGGSFQPTVCTFYHYVPDTDAAFKKAIDAGATVVEEPRDQFWGDRTATVKDFAGNSWCFATAKEMIPPDEMMKRAKEAMAG